MDILLLFCRRFDALSSLKVGRVLVWLISQRSSNACTKYVATAFSSRESSVSKHVTASWVFIT